MLCVIGHHGVEKALPVGAGDAHQAAMGQIAQPDMLPHGLILGLNIAKVLREFPATTLGERGP
jgi:hypothetical protein